MVTESTYNIDFSIQSTIGIQDSDVENSVVQDSDNRNGRRTGFDPFDVTGPTVKRYGNTYPNRWAYLNTIDGGVQSNERKQQNRDEGRRRDLLTLLTQLGATPYQKDRSEALLGQLSGVDDYNRHSSETAVMAVASLVLNEDDRRVRQEEKWATFLLDWDVSSRQVRTLRKKFRQYL